MYRFDGVGGQRKAHDVARPAIRLNDELRHVIGGISPAPQLDVHLFVGALLAGIIGPGKKPEREIRRTKEELARALAIMRATLEATTDGILVTDEKGKVADFNDKYLAMWQIPRKSLEGGTPIDVRELASRNFADPHRFFSRIREIDSTSEESFDVLELEDGRIFERSSKVLAVEGHL
jgi:PAS domain-containing protein